MTPAATPTRFLSLEDVLFVTHVATGGQPVIRDVGLLDSATHRPRTTLFGADAYPSLYDKAAALLESIVRNRALVDGNKRTAWLACSTFLDLNDAPLDAPDDEAYELVIGLAEGRVELDEIAATLEGWCGSA